MLVFLGLAYSQKPVKLNQIEYIAPPHISISIGLTMLNKIDVGNSSKTGIAIGANIFNFYFDAGFNGASGDGKKLDYRSEYSYETYKVSWTTFNVGYSFFLINNNLWITPTIGGIITRNIYQDSLLWTTWYYNTSEFKSSIGLLITLRTNKIYVTFGANTVEIFKLSLGYIIL